MGLNNPIMLQGVTSIEKSAIVCYVIDLFHNGGPTKYSFVLMLISLSSVVAMREFQKNMLTKMRPVGPININQEPIWSVQLPYSVCEMAFSQVGLFLD